ncbi:MAG: glycogen synthase GlgA [Caldisericia bacterium]|nr:glycogen synthase GlgA [Caldisericia bacterium]
MKITFVVSEAVPYIKTGGLADVAGSLPKYLKRLGVDVTLILPFYKAIKEKNLNLEYINNINININDKIYDFKVYIDKENFIFDTYFIENDQFFLRDGIYNENNIDYKDNYLRFGLFSLASLKFIKDYVKSDIIHTHDWQASFIQIYNKIFNFNFKTILTIHNLAYQGIFEKESLFELGLPENLFSIDFLEFYGKINILKGGILFSDLITTVSPTYSKEIQKEEFGFGLDGILRLKRDKIFGILNGIDYEFWNPETDKYIYANYNSLSIENKKINKLNLYKNLNLNFNIDLPLYTMITRITDQKGVDLLINIFDDLMKLDLYLIILGVGDKEYEKKLFELSSLYKDKFLFLNKFDEPLSHLLYASSDFFLMPSKFEPCGLSQMISLRYGAVPIVRGIGGLKDTIIEFNERVNCGNGFVFYEYDEYEFLNAIKRAQKTYNQKDKLLKIIKIGMNSDYSWESSSLEYKNLYENLILK